MASLQRVVRSWLFVAGNRPDRFREAVASGADAVILDLEDLVPASEKAAARAAVAKALDDFPGICIRVNGRDTPWHVDDVRAVVSHPNIVGLVIPKTTDADTLTAVAARPGLALLPMIESANAFPALDAIASAAGVDRLMLGAFDLRLDLGVDGASDGDGDGDELQYFRSRLVLASRLANIAAPIDGATATIDDAALLLRVARTSKRRGFGGKLCIHARQIAPVNAGFAYTAEETAWARRVVEAVRASGGGSVEVDGKMVERPMQLKADRILKSPQS